jgi:hypothetical protein
VPELRGLLAWWANHLDPVLADVTALLSAEEHGERFESVAGSAEALFALRARIIELGPPGIYRAGQSPSLREAEWAAARAHRAALIVASIETEAYYEAREAIAARKARYDGPRGVSSPR